MTNYPYEMQLVVDPTNPRNVVAGGSVSIYDSADTGHTTLLTLTDPNGVPIANPIVSNANGFTEPFVTTSPQVLWVSGDYVDYFNSYVGLRDEAVAAKTAAETAAATAGTDAAAIATAAIGTATDEAAAAATAAASAQAAANASATAAANSAALVGAPADTAIAAAINGAGATKTALNASFAPQGSASPRQVGDGKSGALDYRHEGTAGYITHFVMGANSLTLAGCHAAGTDLGLGDGFFVSHKNSGAGIRGIGQGGSSILQYMVGYSHSTLYNGEIFKGNQGMKLFAKIGEGYGDGIATSGSTVFTSATAVFTGADVGATLSQTTNKGTLNVSGTIPSGTTIVSVTNATTVVLSAAATASGTGINFLIGGRAPAATQSLFTMYDTNGTTKRYEFTLGKYTGLVPHEVQSNDVAAQSLMVKAAVGQTSEIFTVLKDGSASGALSVLSTGLVALRFGGSINNAADPSRNALTLTNYAAAFHTMYVKGAASQTGDQIHIEDSTGAIQSRFDKDGVLMIRRSTAPTDGAVATGELAFWFDTTNGAAKLMIKAKQADGTVKTGSVTLA